MSEGTAEPIRIASDVSVQMAFACENISTDPMGRVSFFTLMEQLNAASFPVATPFMTVVFGFARSVPGFLVQCRVEIIPPQGDPLFSQPIQDLAFRPDQMTQRAAIAIQGVTWPAPGVYTVRFTSRGSTIASFPLRLALLQPPPSAGG